MAKKTESAKDTIEDTQTEADFLLESESDESSEVTSTLRVCHDCGETKHFTEFKPLPPSQGKDARSKTCVQCVTVKAAETRDANNGVRSGGQNRDWIIQELTKQYRKTNNINAKIRCLETLAKLQPQDQKTQLDDPAVVRSLIAGMKAKKKSEE